MKLNLPRRRWRLVLACLACLVVIFWWQLAATRGGEFNRAQFDAIGIGMSVAEVTQMVGAPSLARNNPDRTGWRREYVWHGKGGAMVLLIFDNKVHDKYYELPVSPVMAARACRYWLRVLVPRYRWWLLLVAISGLAITVREMKLWQRLHWLRLFVGR